MPLRAENSPAVFLDRDGVINEDVGHLGEVEHLRLLPRVPASVKRLNEHGIPVIVVSNQSSIGRAIFSEGQIQEINRSIADRLRLEGAEVKRSYYCPHHPTEGKGSYRVQCECRKPNPGMLQQAANELGLDLTRSVMVGDNLTDIEAGQRAGCGTILVAENRDDEFWTRLKESHHQPDQVVTELAEAVDWILYNLKTS